MPNKTLQTDILQAVRFGVSLELHFTPKQTAYKMPLNEALCEKSVRYAHTSKSKHNQNSSLFLPCQSSEVLKSVPLND